MKKIIVYIALFISCPLTALKATDNNVCRISFTKVKSDCDGTCQSQMVASQGEPLDYDDFLKPKEEHIEGLNYIYRRIALSKLIDKNCRENGKRLILSGSCKFKRPNRYTSLINQTTVSQCRQMQEKGFLQELTNPKFARENAKEIIEIGEKMDFQRKFTFLMGFNKEAEGASYKPRGFSRTKHFKAGKSFFKEIFGKDYCPREKSLCTLQEVFNSAKASGDVKNYAELQQKMLKDYMKREYEITEFIAKDPLLMTESRPRLHVYPAFESIRKMAMGEKQYNKYIRKELYDPYLKHPKASYNHSQLRSIQGEINETSKIDFLRDKSVHINKVNPHIFSDVKSFDQPSISHNVAQLSQLNLQNNIETMEKLCIDPKDTKGISLGQLMNSPGLEKEAKRYLKPNQEKNLQCFRAYLKTTEESYANKICLSLGVASLTVSVGSWLVPIPGARIVGGVTGAGGLICDYMYGSIREYIDTQRRQTMCHQAYNFFSEEGSNRGPITNTCSSDQIRVMHQRLVDLLPWVGIEAIFFPLSVLDTLSDIKRVFKLSQKQLRALGKATAEALDAGGAARRMSSSVAQKAKVIDQELMRQLKIKNPALKIFTNDELLSSLSKVCK